MKRIAAALCFCLLAPPSVAEPKTQAVKQIIKDGSQGVVHTGPGDINITGYTKAEHRRILLEEKAQLRKDLEALYSAKSEASEAKRQLLEQTLKNVQVELENLTQSYEDKIQFLQNTINELRSFKGEINDDLLAKAESELQIGETHLADKLFEQIEKQAEGPIKQAAKAAFERGKIAQEQYDYQAAYRLYKRAIELEPDNPEYLSYAGFMAGTVAKHEKEIEWNTQALKLYITQEGENTPTTSRLRNNLAGAYQSLGQYDKAIEHFQLALSGDLKTYGEDHLSVARDRNNLGAAYYSLGQYKKATKYYQSALSSILKIYGEDHPSVAILRNNLGEAYRALGQYDKAIEYFQLALTSDLKTYGEDHPKVAIYRNNLGSAYLSLGQYDIAIEYFNLALASNLKTYGEDHPTVATCRNNLGEAYRALSQYHKAIEYYQLALAVFEKVLGKDHPNTQTVLKNLRAAEAASKN